MPFKKKLKVSVTLHPYYSYVANILGDRAEVVPLFPAGFNTHAYEPRADGYTVQSGHLEGLGLGAGVRYVAKRFGDDANRMQLPATALVDAAIRYDFAALNPSWKALVFVSTQAIFSTRPISANAQARCFANTVRAEP